MRLLKGGGEKKNTHCRLSAAVRGYGIGYGIGAVQSAIRPLDCEPYGASFFLFALAISHWGGGGVAQKNIP